MAARDRVLNALNFLTGEGITYYADGCDARDRRAIEALITDYFSNGNDVSEDLSDHSENQSDDEVDNSNIGGTQFCSVISQ